MSAREAGCSHGGGTMLARRCFLRRRASQRGRSARWGGRRGGVLPYGGRDVRPGGEKGEVVVVGNIPTADRCFLIVV